MEINVKGNAITFVRGEKDPKFYGVAKAKGEHALFHYLKKYLNSLGFSFIKKRIQADGHLMGDEFQPYLRSKTNSEGVYIAIYSSFYVLRGAEKDWNEGKVILSIIYNDYTKVQKSKQLVRKILGGKDNMIY